MIGYSEEGRLDGQGTTGSELCCRSWKEWPTRGRELRHSVQRTLHVGGYGWTAERPMLPRGMIYDTDDDDMDFPKCLKVLKRVKRFSVQTETGSVSRNEVAPLLACSAPLK